MSTGEGSPGERGPGWTRGGHPTMPPIFKRLQQATKTMSRWKILLVVLGCSTVSLLIHQGAQLSW